ncbi:hypothetical protein BGP77_12825 [Saccharospirillum sp. MSK14-1]|uniref:sugar ABC transporter substrate-binding protein n=1 Tax=Saccharospirillum sp. MSK14-1 TaxID=1897632 RepID=UPI000D39519B|nr:extracellular solute-binding protein [Saccharospirillum sp. MSK14-1]PTY37388.1 hypothetical protein BGP77_12825 [Saccharospirillum sp. MSK14-1]
MIATLRLPAALLLLVALMTPAHAFEQGSLLVWVDPGRDIDELTRLAEAYSERTGVTVEVAAPEQGRRAFQQREVDNDGPDIYIGQHQHLTDWAMGGVVTAIEPRSTLRNAINEPYWSVLTFQDVVYGYPLALEGAVQACNADQVDAPFDTWQAVWQAESSLARQNARPLLFDATNLYLNYGLMSAQGGYVFGRDEAGLLNTQDVGLSAPAAIAAMSFMQSMIEGDLLPARLTTEDVDDAFTADRAACVLTAANALPDYEAAGVDLLVGPYPSLSGQSGRGFGEVTAAFINSATPNKTLSRRFIEDALLSEAGFDALTETLAPAAPLHEAALEQWQEDEDWHARAWTVWQTAELQPSVPAMALYWMFGSAAMEAILEQQAPIQSTLSDAAAQIAELAVIPEPVEEDEEE